MPKQFTCYKCGDVLELDELDKKREVFVCSNCGVETMVSKSHRAELGIPKLKKQEKKKDG